MQLGLQGSVDFATLLTSITYKNRTLTDTAKEILSGFVNVQASVAMLVRARCWWPQV